MPSPRPPKNAAAFRKLHESGCFVIPNPWNVGSARYLQGLGFKALASTSSGYAHSQGFADGALTRDMVLDAFPRDRARRPTFRSMPISRTASRTSRTASPTT